MEPLGASLGQISDVTRSLRALHACCIIVCQAMDVSMDVDPSIESGQALGMNGPMKSSYCISAVVVGEVYFPTFDAQQEEALFCILRMLQHLRST